MAIGDTDGDGRDEIVVLRSAPYPKNSVLRLDGTLALLSSSEVDHQFNDLVIEPTTAARKNVVAVENVYSYGYSLSRLLTLDPVSGEEVSRSPLLIGTAMPNSVHYVDPAGDGKLRLAIGTQVGMYLTR